MVYGGINWGGTARGSVSAPRQLPATSRRFVGRAAEQARLTDALNDAGEAGDAGLVLLITGMGGAGKTALAVRWARSNLGRFPDDLDLPIRDSTPLAFTNADDVLAWFDAEHAALLATQRMSADRAYHRDVWLIGSALTLFRAVGHSFHEADTLHRLGLAHTALGNHAFARSQWTQALGLFRTQRRTAKVAEVVSHLAGSSGGSLSGSPD
ncbi:hypothetical protein ACQPZF_16355 [Actinosynnema sp. CS-041913]|uniref:hypothetical protein n=1 Tax=Actinosynnema sp. CS-041913 TaxID=3239917 RepID=UPI003D8DCF58